MNSETKKFYRKIVLWYLQFRDSQYYSVSLHTCVLLVSALLLFLVVIPEVRNWFSVQQEVTETTNRIAVMRDNLRLVQAISDVQLREDFTTATAALPADHDVSRVLTALNYASIQSGVGMEDFSFHAGEALSRPTKNQSGPTEATLQLTFTVVGSLPQVIGFLAELQEKMPLLSVSSVDAAFVQENAARISLLYHYKPLPLYQESSDTPLQDLSPENRLLLKKLQSWEVPSETEFIPVGSESAEPL